MNDRDQPPTELGDEYDPLANDTPEAAGHDPALDELAQATRDAEQAERDQLYGAFPLTEQGRLDLDLTCIACGYNLRGHAIDGTCSECGTPVDQSLRTEQIFQADIDWVTKLKRGLIWVLIGIGAQFGIGLIIGIVFAAIFATSPQTANNPVLMAVLTIVGTLIYNGILVYGLLLLTAPEPGETDPPLSRTIARYVLLASFAIELLAGFSMLLPSVNIEMVSTIIQTIAGILLTVGLPALMLYLRSLAQRIPAPSLAKQTTIVMWGLTISLATLNGGGLVVYLYITSVANQQGPPMEVLGLALCPSLVGMMVFGIWWIVLLCLYLSQFNKSIHMSRQHTSAIRHGEPMPNDDFLTDDFAIDDTDDKPF